MSKKSKAPAQEVPVLSGPCVYITYTVSRVSSLLSTEETESAPTCTVTLKGPTLEGPCTSEPCRLSDVGSYQLNYSAQSKHALDKVEQDLPKILNSSLLVEVSADAEVVGHAELDLLPVASNASASVQARLNLVQSQGERSLLPNANVTVAVLLTRDPPEPSEGGAAVDECPSAESVHASIPFHLVDVSTVSESTVLTLGPASATDLPSGFCSAAAAVSCGLNVQIALIWRTGTSWTGACSSQGVYRGTELSWNTSWRTYIKSEDFCALKDAIERGSDVYVEIARYLAKPEEGIDSAFSNYHAVTKLSNDSIQALKQPGCKHLVAALHFDSTYNTTSSTFEEYPLPSMLPQRPPDAPKAKAIEAALPVRPGGEECCAWSGSRFLLDMAFTNPTIPEWQPPPKPEKTLDEILTKRTHENSQGSSAVGAYQSSLQGIINRLMKEYVSCDIESSKTLGRQLNPQELRKRLIFELNRRGLYVDMKEKLRESMHALAKEKFDAGTSARLLPICSPLYAFMLDEMHASINQAMGVQDNPTDHADHATSLQLTRIAAECEMQGDMQRAKKLHEQRLTTDDAFEAWREFAMFCMRQGDHERGEECFRQALVQDSTQIHALIALACICWYKGNSLDTIYYEDAIALVHAAKDRYADQAMPWALLTMLFDASCSPDTRATEVRNAQFKAQTIATSKSNAASTLQSAPFLELEVLLLDMHLGSLALKTHVFAQRQPDNEKFKLQLALCKAQGTALEGELDTAVNMLKTAVRSTGKEYCKALLRQTLLIQQWCVVPGSHERITANVLLGKICEQAGDLKRAQEAYEAAIQCSPQDSPQEAYLHLGKLYMQQGLFEYASDVYTHACSIYSCGSSWLGLGLAYLRMGKLADADLVLAEAVTCDPQNPIPRSYLALIHILVENQGEACECLETAEKLGLSDPSIMQEVGEAFASKGMFHDAAALLRRAVSCYNEPPFSLLASLGEAHLSCHDLRAARAAWENARVVAKDGEVELSDAALSNIKTLQGDLDDCQAAPVDA